MPWFVSKSPQVCLAEILHPNPSQRGLMVIHSWNTDAYTGQEFPDLDVMLIFITLAAVLDKNDGPFSIRVNSVKFTVRAALLEGLYLKSCTFHFWKVGDAANLNFRKLGGSHRRGCEFGR